MNPNDTYQLQVIGTAVGNQHIHDLHFRQVTPGLGAADLITDWTAAAMTQYRALFHTTMAPTQILRARQVCGSTPLEAYYDVAPAPASTMGTRAAAGDQQPAFLATHVKLRTALAGRSRIGKFFLGGMMELDVAYNDVQAAYLTLVQAYCAALAARGAFQEARRGRRDRVSGLIDARNHVDAHDPRYHDALSQDRTRAVRPAPAGRTGLQQVRPESPRGGHSYLPSKAQAQRGRTDVPLYCLTGGYVTPSAIW
jgi:hypothetical protein